MEQGLGRLIEAAQVAATIDGMRLEILPKGVRCYITWEGKDHKFFTHENTTPWRAIHPRPHTKNPLIGAFDALVKAKTEHEG